LKASAGGRCRNTGASTRCDTLAIPTSTLIIRVIVVFVTFVDAWIRRPIGTIEVAGGPTKRLLQLANFRLRLERNPLGRSPFLIRSKSRFVASPFFQTKFCIQIHFKFD
jgi:hypothetical protein